jgi:uncharacterized protein YciI
LNQKNTTFQGGLRAVLLKNEMDQFLIHCDINTDLLHQIDTLRPNHLNYIKSKSNVTCGGVLLDEANKYKGICYVIKADSRSQAEDFVKQDPYFEIYSKFEITKFIQKLPKP